MKILMINVVCGISSTGRICTDIATKLINAGHEVIIAYGRGTVPEKYKQYSVRIGNDFDYKLHCLNARLFDKCGFGSKRATEKFIEWVISYDPDVIHIHNIHGYYINIEVLFNYLRNCGKKIIWTLHDCWAFTGHSAYCDVVECKRWIDGCYKCPIRLFYPASYINNCSYNWKKKKELFSGIPFLQIVTPSKWLANLTKKSFLGSYPISVINNGIDTSQFHPMISDFKEKNNIIDKTMLLGVSAVWDKMKGYYDFLKLAERLSDDYIIVLVGINKRQKRDLPRNIIGIERTNCVSDLACIYSAADLFLNLSYCENYPTVNLEANACGTTVLTYSSGGSPESAFNSITVKRGDLDAVVNEILKFRKSISTFDYEAADMNTMIEKYLRIIDL